MDKTYEQEIETGLSNFHTLTKTMKQALLASSLFAIVVCVNVTLYVQFLIKSTTVTTANPLQSDFTLVK